MLATTGNESLQIGQITSKELLDVPENAAEPRKTCVKEEELAPSVLCTPQKKKRHHPFLWRRVAFYSAANAYDKQAMSRPKPGHPLNYGQAEI